MHVPGFHADEAIVGCQSHPCNDADEADSGFNQSAGEQQILSEGVSSVAIADVVGFGIDVERIGGGGALQQAEGAGLQLLQSFGGGVCGEFGGDLRCDVIEQLSAGLQAAGGDIGCGGEGGGSEAGRGGVIEVLFADEQRAAVDPKEASAAICGFSRGCSAAEFLQPDVGRDGGLCGLQSSDDGAEGG